MKKKQQTTETKKINSANNELTDLFVVCRNKITILLETQAKRGRNKYAAKKPSTTVEKTMESLLLPF